MKRRPPSPVPEEASFCDGPLTGSQAPESSRIDALESLMWADVRLSASGGRGDVFETLCGHTDLLKSGLTSLNKKVEEILSVRTF